MERRGSLYFSSEHTAYSPVNLGYLCEAINDDFISMSVDAKMLSRANASERAFLRPDRL